jgi:hypothetical protein
MGASSKPEIGASGARVNLVVTRFGTQLGFAMSRNVDDEKEETGGSVDWQPDQIDLLSTLTVLSLVQCSESTAQHSSFRCFS